MSDMSILHQPSHRELQVSMAGVATLPHLYCFVMFGQSVLLAMMVLGTIGPVILIVRGYRRLRSIAPQITSWRWRSSMAALVLGAANLLALAAFIMWSQGRYDAHYFDTVPVWARTTFGVAVMGIVLGAMGYRGERVWAVLTNFLVMLAWFAFGSVAV